MKTAIFCCRFLPPPYLGAQLHADVDRLPNQLQFEHTGKMNKLSTCNIIYMFLQFSFLNKVCEPAGHVLGGPYRGEGPDLFGSVEIIGKIL